MGSCRIARVEDVERDLLQMHRGFTTRQLRGAKRLRLNGCGKGRQSDVVLELYGRERRHMTNFACPVFLVQANLVFVGTRYKQDASRALGSESIQPPGCAFPGTERLHSFPFPDSIKGRLGLRVDIFVSTLKPP